jgi:hypothetical protein
MSPVIKCRSCGCSEENPCRLETNEDCILNVVTLLCNNPKCILASIGVKRQLDARKREETARLVRPIEERFLEKRRRDRERRRKTKPKKQQRRAA